MSDGIFGLNIPFGELLGIEALEREHGIAHTALNIKPELKNSWGAAHGGAILTLLDLTLGMAAISLDPACKGSITVEIKVNFIRASTGRILAEGRAMQSGKSLVFCEGEARNEAGEILAKATGTFKLHRPDSKQ
ncbi:MAG: PaaI family thioesterase [Burkholderiales bacterium]